jgi:hypothetical protein
MAETKSALYTRTLACPACGSKTLQPDFKTGMYTEEERESDQHVTRYRWLQPDLPPLHPPYYALFYCPECAFTDFKEDFAEPNRLRDNRVRLLAPKLKSEIQRRGSCIATLRQGIGSVPLEFPAALRGHLLALAIQELLPGERRDHLKIARLFLRVAWLYREQGDSTQPSLQDTEGLAALDQFAAALRELITAVERVRTVFETTPSTPKLGALVRQVQALSRPSAELRVALLAKRDRGDGLGFLTLLRGEWPQIPANEASALEAAIHAFEKVYESGDADTMGLLKIMIDLNYRLGCFDRVLEYASSISKTAYEERTALQRQLADRTLPADQRTRLTARANRIQATLDLAADIRRQVIQRQDAARAA